MPIDMALEDAGDLTIATQSLADDLNKLCKRMDAGPMKEEVARLWKRAETIFDGMKRLEQATAFARHDRDVQRDAR